MDLKHIILRKITVLFSKIAIFWPVFSWFLFVTAQNDPLRGVPESKKFLYKSDNGMWKCLNTSQYISFSRINDDWCDCLDGSDEPGTSACHNGIFLCKNKGHISKYIPSSYVNDGICDCCDGSDEYTGVAECKDTCVEENEKYHQEMLKKQDIYEKGSKVRQKWVKKLEDFEKELDREIKHLSDELREAIYDDQKIKNLKHFKMSEDILNKNDTFFETFNHGLYSLFDYQNEKLSSLIDFLKSQTSILDNTIELLKNTNSDDASSKTINDVVQTLKGLSEEAVSKNNEYAHYLNNLKNQYDEFSKIIEKKYSLFFKKKSIFESIEQWITLKIDGVKRYLISHKILIDNEATNSQLLMDYEISDDSNHKIVELKKKLEEKKSIKEKRSKDSNVYHAVENEKLSFKFKEYLYEFTFLKNAYQISTNDHMRIFLGSFSHFDGPNKLYYHNGDRCWNGPSRSVIIELQCGIKNEIVSVIEYQRCVYFMKLLTPGACILPSNKIQRDEL